MSCPLAEKATEYTGSLRAGTTSRVEGVRESSESEGEEGYRFLFDKSGEMIKQNIRAFVNNKATGMDPSTNIDFVLDAVRAGSNSKGDNQTATQFLDEFKNDLQIL